jgi:hypothetical protein
MLPIMVKKNHSYTLFLLFDFFFFFILESLKKNKRMLEYSEGNK